MSGYDARRHRLGGCAVTCAVSLAISVLAAGPAGAARGGNNDTQTCASAADGRRSFSHAGAPFRNQGDCVNDGAQGLALQPGPLDPQTACLSLAGRPSFRNGADGSWTCTYQAHPGPREPTVLEEQCSGGLRPTVDEGVVTAFCIPE
jgi:hypothetical protein